MAVDALAPADEVAREGLRDVVVLLVQWLAPLASESPEFVIAALFAWRLWRAGHPRLENVAPPGLGRLNSGRVEKSDDARYSYSNGV